MKKGNSVMIFILIVAFVVIAALAIYFVSKGGGDNTNQNANNKVADNSNGSVAGTSSDKNEITSTPNAEIIIFYGSTCPHCKKVDQFIVENKIDKIVPLQHLEVYSNRQNASLMQEKLNACKDLSDDDKGGVPFMYTPDKCVVGDTPIIDYLKEKAGV